MKIAEILTESKQLDEGPILNKIGTAVGKGVGALGKGVGAAIGGAVGLGKAIKKGYQAGKDVVSLAGDDEPATPKTRAADPGDVSPSPTPTAPAAQAAAPAATQPGGGAGAQPAAKDINAAGPKGTPPAANLTGAAKTAADKVAAATQDQNAAQAGQTMYAQMKANIDKLDKKGKQRLLALLQKSIAQAPTRAAPAAAPATGGAGAMGQMAAQLGASPAASAAANIPVSKTNTAKPGNPNLAATGTTPATGAPTAKKGVKIPAKKKPAAAAAPAAQPQTASIVHNGKVIAEGLSLFRKN